MINTIYKRKQEIVKAKTETTAYYNQDHNRDGVPDYLQKGKDNLELKSLVKATADMNLDEVDASKILEKFEMHLRGRRFNPSHGSFEKWTKEIVNNVGINEIMAYVTLEVNKTTMNTNYTQEWINIQCEDVALDFVGYCADNKIRWELSTSDLNPLTVAFDIFFNACLCKSLNGKQGDHITNRVKITENRSAQPQPITSM